MKRFVLSAAAMLCVLLLWRVIDLARFDRLGDVVSLGVLGVTLAVEGIIVGGGIWKYRNDPRVFRLHQAKADLEALKIEKSRRQRFAARGY